MAIPHGVQKLVTAAEMHVLAQFLLHPGLNPRPIPDTASGGVCSDGTSQQQQLGVAQQGGRTAVVVPLVLQARQPTGMVSVDDFVRTLVGVTGQLQGLRITFPLRQKGEQLTPAALNGTGTSSVNSPEVLGGVLKVNRSDAPTITD